MASRCVAIAASSAQKKKNKEWTWLIVKERASCCSPSLALQHYDSITITRQEEEEKQEQELGSDGLLDASGPLHMHHSPELPLSNHLYVSMLKVCIQAKDIIQVRHIHRHLLQQKSDFRGSLGQHLVVAFAKCGAPADAYTLLLSLSHRTVFTWTAIIVGYTECGCASKAMESYYCMLDDGIQPNQYTFVSILKACASMQNIQEIMQHHCDAQKYGFTMNVFVGTTLISSYGKIQKIKEAEILFNELSQRNSVSWNALLSSYLEQGEGERVLQLYRQMQEEKVDSNQQTFVITFQACANIGEKEGFFCMKGKTSSTLGEVAKALHADSQKKGFIEGSFVGSTLVRMYGKCGSIGEAENVFGALTHRNVVAWSAMLLAYAEGIEKEKALQLFRQMQEEGVSPDEQIVAIALKACDRLVEDENAGHWEGWPHKPMVLEIGITLHAETEKKCAISNVYISNIILSMHGKHGSIVEAERVFDGLCQRNSVTWNTMLSAYMEHTQEDKLLCLFRQMLEERVSTTQRTFLIATQACSALLQKGESIADRSVLETFVLELGRALYSEVRRKGFLSDTFVCSALINLYGRSQSIVEAENAFDGLHEHNVVVWGAMLSAYTHCGHADRVLWLYKLMLEEDVFPDQQAFAVILQACYALVDKEEKGLFVGMCLDIGKALHIDAERQGFTSDAFIGCALVSLYGKCGSILEAEYVFNCLPGRDIVLWGAMLGLYADQGCADKALLLCRQMLEEGGVLTDPIVVIALQACEALAQETVGVEGQASRLLFLDIGEALQADATRKGRTFNALVNSTLVNMHGKFGSILDVENLIDGDLSTDAALWNAVMQAYIDHGREEKTLQLFRQMQEEGVSPNRQTFVITLQACSALIRNTEASNKEGGLAGRVCLEIGEALHVDLRKDFHSDVLVGSALLSMYGKCGSISEAEKVFNVLVQRDVALWNAMLTAYLEHNHADQVLSLYRKMEEQCSVFDDVTIACALQACGECGDLETCRNLHFGMVANNLSAHWMNTLIRVYGSCASMVDAWEVFDGLSEPEVESWTACIGGYAQEGNTLASLQVFEEMQTAGVTPDNVTVFSLLCACNHAGLVNVCPVYFESMNGTGLKTPNFRHYLLILDIFGRAGDFKSLESVLLGMSTDVDLVMWFCVLSVCRTHGNVEVGKYVFDRALALQPNESGLFILMSNTYIDAGPQELADEVENV